MFSIPVFCKKERLFFRKTVFSSIFHKKVPGIHQFCYTPYIFLHLLLWEMSIAQISLSPEPTQPVFHFKADLTIAIAHGLHVPTQPDQEMPLSDSSVSNCSLVIRI